MEEQKTQTPESGQQTPPAGVTRREFCMKGAAVVGAAAVTLYVPPRLTPVALPAAFAKAAPADKESCEKGPTADKDPTEKDPTSDKDPGEKDPGEKDPMGDKEEEGAFRSGFSPAIAESKDEWGLA